VWGGGGSRWWGSQGSRSGGHLPRAREGDQEVEPSSGGARVDGFTRKLQPVSQVVGVPGGGDRARGVEQDRLARRAGRSGEHRSDCLRVLGRRATAQLLR